MAAIQVRTVRSPTAAGDRPPAVFADSCHFDGGQTGILAEGAVDVVLRDCTMGPGQPSIWFDNARSNVPVFGELRLLHSSIMAGPAPVFRFDGTQARVWVDDSVIAAPAGRSPATLVMVDNSRNLTWRGRSNLYSGIGVYLAYSGRDDRLEPITDFARWSETPTELREAGTIVKAPSVWDAADPAQALLAETDNPTRVFLLSSTITSRSDIGARQGPFGSVLKNVRIAKRARPEDSPASPPLEPAAEPAARQAPEPAASKDLKVAAADPMPVNPAPGDRRRDNGRSRQPPADAPHVDRRRRRQVDRRRSIDRCSAAPAPPAIDRTAGSDRSSRRLLESLATRRERIVSGDRRSRMKT